MHTVLLVACGKTRLPKKNIISRVLKQSECAPMLFTGGRNSYTLRYVPTSGRGGTRRRASMTNKNKLRAQIVHYKFKWILRRKATSLGVNSFIILENK